MASYKGRTYSVDPSTGYAQYQGQTFESEAAAQGYIDRVSGGTTTGGSGPIVGLGELAKNTFRPIEESITQTAPIFTSVPVEIAKDIGIVPDSSVPSPSSPGQRRETARERRAREIAAPSIDALNKLFLARAPGAERKAISDIVSRGFGPGGLVDRSVAEAKGVEAAEKGRLLTDIEADALDQAVREEVAKDEVGNV
jgi:hypothetical protein